MYSLKPTPNRLPPCWLRVFDRRMHLVVPRPPLDEVGIKFVVCRFFAAKEFLLHEFECDFDKCYEDYDDSDDIERMMKMEEQEVLKNNTNRRQSIINNNNIGGGDEKEQPLLDEHDLLMSGNVASTTLMAASSTVKSGSGSRFGNSGDTNNASFSLDDDDIDAAISYSRRNSEYLHTSPNNNNNNNNGMTKMKRFTTQQPLLLGETEMLFPQQNTSTLSNASTSSTNKTIPTSSIPMPKSNPLLDHHQQAEEMNERHKKLQDDHEKLQGEVARLNDIVASLVGERNAHVFVPKSSDFNEDDARVRAEESVNVFSASKKNANTPYQNQMSFFDEDFDFSSRSESSSEDDCL